MDALRLGLFLYVIEIAGLLIFWLLKCLFTRRLDLITKKIIGCVDIIRYLAEYWFDCFCLLSYGIIQGCKAVVQFFWITGMIIGDAARKIKRAAKDTIVVLGSISKWTKRRQAARKQVSQQNAVDAIESSNSSFDPEPVNIASV